MFGRKIDEIYVLYKFFVSSLDVFGKGGGEYYNLFVVRCGLEDFLNVLLYICWDLKWEGLKNVYIYIYNSYSDCVDELISWKWIFFSKVSWNRKINYCKYMFNMFNLNLVLEFWYWKCVIGLVKENCCIKFFF